jgi:hypothetical protein
MTEAIDTEYSEETAVATRPVDALTEFGADDIGMDRGLRIANQLDAIIREKDLAVQIGQGEHLRVEAWCACAAMVGVSPRTVWTKRLPETGPLEGYIARVEVVQIATGRIIGAAEAGCFTDERMGSRARWTEQHAVMSMAQTRATSKAIGQVLRWIPVLAGYSGTPAEEMPRDMPEAAPKRAAASPTAANLEYTEQNKEARAPARHHPITEKQKKLLYAKSIQKAEALISECIEANRPMKYEDAKALRGSIAKHAAEAAGIVGAVHQDEVEPLLDAIERAAIGENGETFIQTEAF